MASSRSGRTSHRRAGGQGLVEFALVAPILIGLAFGIFDFGRGMSANITVTNSSREGARYLATQASTLLTPYGSACPGAGTPPAAPGTGAQSKAWNQMQNANLDLSQVLMLNVYFYKGSNDPSGTGATPDKTVSCSTGTWPNVTLSGSTTPTVTAGSNTGDSTYVPQTGDWVQFRVVYRYTTVTPIIHQVVGSVTIDQTTTMVLE